MKSNVMGVETLAKQVGVDGNTDWISEVQPADSFQIPGGHQGSGTRRNWVMPWLTMSNPVMYPCHCDGYELNTV